jgi:hypothetical protein
MLDKFKITEHTLEYTKKLMKNKLEKKNTVGLELNNI